MRPPVLILSGVGLTAAVALRLVAALETRCDVLQARSTAEAALAALDAAGAKQAHVVGLSFGAAIAQSIAIEHPDRVRSLVLGSSTAGGELYVPPEPVVRAFIGRLDDLPAEEGLWASVPYLYATSTSRRHAPLIGEDVARRLREPLDPRAYRDQFAAGRSHDTVARLAEITAPTLVVHGEQDRILPLANGRRLADAITGARFLSLPGAAHAFLTDGPGTSRELVSFLLQQHSGRSGRAARA